MVHLKIAFFFVGINNLLGSGFLHSLIPQWSNLLHQLNPHMDNDIGKTLLPDQQEVKGKKLYTLLGSSLARLGYF